MKKVNVYIFALLFVNIAFSWEDHVLWWENSCEILPQPVRVTERIQDRDYPSIFQPWNHISETLEDLESWWDAGEDIYHKRITKNDLYFPHKLQLRWLPIETSYEGLSTQIGGDLQRAQRWRETQLTLNPNLVFLVQVRITNYTNLEALPPDSDFWLKDATGQIIQNKPNEFMLDVRHPAVQQLLTNRIIAVANCGFFDGIVIDALRQSEFWVEYHNIGTKEEILEAHLNILKNVRERVRTEFLILVNANDTRPERYKAFVNGSFMETDQWHLTPAGLTKVEDVLLWNERNLREPRINALEGRGIDEPNHSPENERRMRLVTTLSLTHSDGYLDYTTHSIEGHKGSRLAPWYRFWDAPLGRPIGGNETKGILYETPKGVPINGLFIREFTNGWAVYNRSGKERNIQLPEKVSGWYSGVADKRWHTIPDLDGEIYLKKIRVPADVNGDGIVNILDLVATANAFGSDSPDINSDGVVNILDLVRIANYF